MSHLSIDKNRQLLRLEFSDDPCSQLLRTKTKSIRFDITAEDESGIDHLWRVAIELDEQERVAMEFKDYRDNSRHVRILEDAANVSDASCIALNFAWNLFSGHKNNEDVFMSVVASTD